MDLSSSGLGLVARAASANTIEEGDELEVTLRLPSTDRPLTVRGHVMWVYARRGAPRDGYEAALGLRFGHLAAQTRVMIDRYILEHRFRVVIAFASSETRQTLEAALGADFYLYFADTEQGTLDALEQGDMSGLLVCGDDAELAVRIIQRVVEEIDPEFAPAIAYGAHAKPEELVRLFNQRKIHRALSLPLDPQETSMTLDEACRARGERVEKQRTLHALERGMRRQRAAARSTAALDASTRKRVVFGSQVMAEVVERIRQVAPHKISVLLMGDTGTGKEVLAHLVHECSPRAEAPLVVQDCGVLTETLLESELFGHTKGAFTNAVSSHPGLFVMADGGTLFLDEIENTSPDLQAKLLRVIETGVVRPVGGTRTRNVDVRVVAASNRDLYREVEAGRFRADLYYRLSAFVVRVPRLADRREDILPLARQFLAAASEKQHKRILGFSRDVENALCHYAWPGNIRELRNAIEFATVVTPNDRPIEMEHLPHAFAAEPSHHKGGTSLREQVEAAESQIIREALRASGGVLRQAAQRLQTSPTTLRRKALAYGLASVDQTPAGCSRKGTAT